MKILDIDINLIKKNFNLKEKKHVSIKTENIP